MEIFRTFPRSGPLLINGLNHQNMGQIGKSMKLQQTVNFCSKTPKSSSFTYKL